MSIRFSAARWDRIKEDARLWWAGELDRPLVQIRLTGCAPNRQPSRLQQLGGDLTSYDLQVSPEEIVDRWDYELSQTRFLGDSFPAVWPDFGPGVVAAFAGATVGTGHGTVWFSPENPQEISDIRLTYDSSNRWLARIKEIYRVAMERWQGLVQVGMTDLGGNLDIPSTFRPSEALLMDLYDYPEEVKRLTWNAHDLWWSYYEEFNSILRPLNPGYTAWTPIFSEAPYYILQCDFSYMIGPEMFDEFVKPELTASCKRLSNAFYHLDGPGQLAHLDSLLSIQELKGVQWIPGAGQPGYEHWPEVYRKIRDAGKLIQLWGDLGTLDAVAGQLGSAKGIVLITSTDSSRQADAEDFVARYGAAECKWQ